MDEPLSNLDAKLRVQTRNQIAALQRRLGTTTVYVTHDQVEAMTMGDRVAVLCDGVLQQVAAPRELYRNPANVFVAGFIGSPAMNLFTLPIADSSVLLGDWRIAVPRELPAARPKSSSVFVPSISSWAAPAGETRDAPRRGRGARGRRLPVRANHCLRQRRRSARRGAADGRRPPEKGSRVCLHPEPGHVHFFGVDGRRIR